MSKQVWNRTISN